MTGCTIRRIEGPMRAGKKPKGVTIRRVLDSTGKMVSIRAVNAHSPTFGQDLLYVFSKNVEAARRENKRLLGSADGFMPSAADVPCD